MRRRAGVSLVELSVTLAVVAAALGTGAPMLLSKLPVHRVNHAALALVGDLRLARTTAVGLGRDVLVVFHVPAQGQYTLAVDEDGSKNLSGEDLVLKVVDVPSVCHGIAFGSDDAGIPRAGVSFPGGRAIFNPDGRASTGSVYFRPAADAGVRRDRERRVTVLGATARTRAYAWGGAAWE